MIYLITVLGAKFAHNPEKTKWRSTFTRGNFRRKNVKQFYDDCLQESKRQQKKAKEMPYDLWLLQAVHSALLLFDS